MNIKVGLQKNSGNYIRAPSLFEMSETLNGECDVTT